MTLKNEFKKLRNIIIPKKNDTGLEILSGDDAVIKISEFSQKLSYEDIPESAVNQAKNLILQGIAWSVLGAGKPESYPIQKTVGDSGSSGACTILGTTMRSGCAEVVYLNAVHAQVYDCNDGHTSRGAYHAGRVLVPVALTIAEYLQVSGKDLITALVLGYEISHRTRVDKIRQRSEGLGAAVIAGKLLSLSHYQLINSLYLSDQNGPRLYPGPGNFNTDANHINNGIIARAGVEAAFLAKEGMAAEKGPATIHLENDLPNPGDERTFLINQVYIKPYIACHALHNTIGYAVEFHNDHTDLVQDIKGIEVNLVAAADFVSQYITPDTYFKTVHFSLPYCMACALLDGKVDEYQSTKERISDPIVQELHRKVVVRIDRRQINKFPEDSYPTHSKITLNDGRSFTDFRLYPKGTAQNPLSKEERESLFRKWAGSSIKEKNMLQIINTIKDLENLEDVCELIGLIR